ncbi:DUF4224 domain-containing protein [Pectobacterium versatile]|uniref:DUF4224 domain-containing protein n=1 Tax=Pectobacterium versatile TaxID=2488639 RepID=A0AAW3RXB7_9GAMM|nr:DUF4224 domain-containing protein [Pectobacterium versatile]MBA0161167.1 DUF4224 domain-containing protein [Pectobacterium versatile]
MTNNTETTVNTHQVGVNTAQNDIISDCDIETLTGYKIPSKQCETLRCAGIFFITRRDGRPRTTWTHFNNPLSQRHKIVASNTPQPNFGALD